MYIAPNSICYVLKNVEADKNFYNVKYFNNRSEQLSYMTDVNRVVRRYDKLSYVKGNQIKLEDSADIFYNANYLMYQNTSFSGRWFFAFIDSVEYVNNSTTLITFTIDDFQTWFLDLEIKDCFVEREHVLSDEIGEHTILEGIEYGTLNIFKNEKMTHFSDVNTPPLFIAEVVLSDSQWDGLSKKLSTYSNVELGKILQGCRICYTTNSTDMTEFLTGITSSGYSSAIQSVYTIPSSLQPSQSEGTYLLAEQLEQMPDNFYGYKPKNNKLFCYPYCAWFLYSPNGSNMVLEPELWKSRTYTIRGTKGTRPTIIATPTGYKNAVNDFTQSVTINYGEVGSFSYDAYQAMIASYGYGQLGGELVHYYKNSLVNTGIGLAGTVTTGLINPVAGAVSAVGTGISGISSILSAGAQQSQDMHNSEALQGNATTAPLYTLGLKDIYYQIKMIKKEYAEIIDNFFSVFGYKVNRFKTPNINGRPSWNYVKCATFNCSGDIPSDVMAFFETLFINGLTFWKTSFGNYSADNSIL